MSLYRLATVELQLVMHGIDLRSLLKVWGYSIEQADIFGKQVELHAAETLYDLQFPTNGDGFAILASRLELVA